DHYNVHQRYTILDTPIGDYTFNYETLVGGEDIERGDVNNPLSFESTLDSITLDSSTEYEVEVISTERREFNDIDAESVP
ncbi:MAG: hypothetical protein DRP42_08040, partial [Tenericutes bacterium]